MGSRLVYEGSRAYESIRVLVLERFPYIKISGAYLSILRSREGEAVGGVEQQMERRHKQVKQAKTE